MEKVVPLFKPFTNIFCFKFFQLGRVLLRAIKISNNLNMIRIKFSPPLGTVAPGPLLVPHFLPVQTTAPNRRPPPPGAHHCRPGPHSARTSDPPLFSPPGSPTCASLFLFPSARQRNRRASSTELPSPAALSPHPAPPKLLLHRCLSLSAPEPRPTKLPRPAISSGETPFPLHLPPSVGAPCVPMAELP
jgi:hypothetical protein